VPLNSARPEPRENRTDVSEYGADAIKWTTLAPDSFARWARMAWVHSSPRRTLQESSRSDLGTGVAWSRQEVDQKSGHHSGEPADRCHGRLRADWDVIRPAEHDALLITARTMGLAAGVDRTGGDTAQHPTARSR